MIICQSTSINSIIRSKNTTCKIVPVMVGDLNKEKALEYGNIFAEYMNESSLFVVSSDFCHWGSGFSYYYVGEGIKAEETNEIWKHIRNLDLRGIEFIENLDIDGFMNYLEETGNTICGQNPILLLMSTIASTNNPNVKLKFIAYDQSNKATNIRSSSVSYASAYVTM